MKKELFDVFAPYLVGLCFTGVGQKKQVPVISQKTRSRWWFQLICIFTPTWGNDPI